nr:MAG TPA: hypothetical protein [Caudoviricetes sp.]
MIPFLTPFHTTNISRFSRDKHPFLSLLKFFT